MQTRSQYQLKLSSDSYYKSTTKPSLSTSSSFYPPSRAANFSPSVTGRVLHAIALLLRWCLLIPLILGLFKLTLAVLVILAQSIVDGINHIRHQHPHRWQPKRYLRFDKPVGMATPNTDHANVGKSSLSNETKQQPASNGCTAETEGQPQANGFVDHLDKDDESGEIPAIYARADDRISQDQDQNQNQDETTKRRTQSINRCSTLSATSLSLGWLALVLVLLLIVTWSDLSTIALG